MSIYFVSYEIILYLIQEATIHSFNAIYVMTFVLDLQIESLYVIENISFLTIIFEDWRRISKDLKKNI